MAGNHSRRKGYRVEREVVETFQRVGMAAERVPLSGGAGGSYTGDVTIPLMGIDFRIEVKCRAKGFREIYNWIDRMDALVIRADKSDPLIVLRLHDFADLAIEVEKSTKSPLPFQACTGVAGRGGRMMEPTYAVMGETHEGTILALRRGFATREEAEDHRVKLSAWKRVWVEQCEPPRQPKDELPPLPWGYETSGSPSANGLFNLYLTDANGRKIAAIWGRGNEKRLTAETILKAVNPHD